MSKPWTQNLDSSSSAMFRSTCLTADATLSLAVLVLRIYVLKESPGQQRAPATDSLLDPIMVISAITTNHP